MGVTARTLGRATVFCSTDVDDFKRSQNNWKVRLIGEKLSKVIDVEEPTEPLERVYLVFRSQIAWICLYVARIGRLDILQSGNKLARAVTMSTRAWDRRHNTSNFKQYFHVRNTAEPCRVGLFPGS